MDMKRLVICCDGTWNRADQVEKNGRPCVSNVVKIAVRVAKRDGATPQIVYYDQGVGTGNFFDRVDGWDTVGALGIPIPGGDTHKFAFHDTELSGNVHFAYHALAIDERRGPFQPSLWDFKPKPEQKIEQVWFAGVHSDVGGGYQEPGLSDIAMQWMMDKAGGTGLALDQES